ncbi:winged helix-turn-helix transcriptional regulator [Saccharothrix sp. HUAS TT1]|uniref:winged helix-turn-helix transcriptional regulator n=1 Tax=unclassified Saccharothrix TaxID=2593673 RepID=UPI00345BDAD8
MAAPDDPACSLAKAVELVGERWTIFVLHEALMGATRFSEFRSRLGIASDVLTARLAKLVDSGLLARHGYREPGQRARDCYLLTESGRRVSVVLCALQQWGGEHFPDVAPDVEYRTAGGRPVSVRFVDDEGAVTPPDEVRVRRP